MSENIYLKTNFASHNFRVESDYFLYADIRKIKFGMSFLRRRVEKNIGRYSKYTKENYSNS